jgi:hypothetical protein
MKRQRVEIKKVIKKRIEQRHLERVFMNRGERLDNIISVKTEKPMNERDLQRIYGNNVPEHLLPSTEDFGANRDNVVYQKKVRVDYDVVICIPSHERFNKVARLITQFYNQPTKYTFKIILLNDGSKSLYYSQLTKRFPEIIYEKNRVANGKTLHWYCYNQLWKHLKDIQCHAVLQMDDDFILSDGFLDNIMDLYFRAKEKNGSIAAIAPHLWSFKKSCDFETWWNRTDFVDGIALIDDEIIKYMSYQMKPVDAEAVSKEGVPVRAWTQISAAIKEMRRIIYRTPKSLVYHDGNDDSKLHGKFRSGGKAGVYTQKYIGKI